MENPSKNPKTIIPNHLIVDKILPKIPVKSLCRFKCVSHGWNSAIKSINFASRFVLTIIDNGDILEASEFCGDMIIDSNTFADNSKPCSVLVSSCNGLALMISYDETELSLENHYCIPNHLHLLNFYYVVHNPALGADHFVEIPHPQEYLLVDGYEHTDNYNFGFGYVSSRDDYYIVAVDSTHNSKISVYTYSLRSQQWNDQILKIREEHEEALPLDFQNNWYIQTGILANEALHWGVMEGKDNKFILAYDLVSLEKWRLIDLPFRGLRSSRICNFQYFSLSYLDDCLCAWANEYSVDNRQILEMWMMKEYGVVESWTKLFCLQLNGHLFCRRIFGFTKPKMVLLFTLEGELIVVDFSYDPPKLMNVALEDRMAAVSYVPSHVSVFSLISEPQE